MNDAEPVQIDLSPISNLTQAKGYVSAARILHEFRKDGITAPQYFLISHAIELLLKAYILACGGTERQLRTHEVRHSLSNLFALAKETGFKPTSEATEIMIEMLAPYHSEHSFRYLKEGCKTYPAVEDALVALEQLHADVAPAVHSVTLKAIAANISGV